MSEQAPNQNNEHLPDFEILAKANNSEKLLPDAEHAEPLRNGEKDPAQAIVEARKDIAETTRAESQHNPIEELEEAQKASQTTSPTHINRELKQITLQRELQQIRRQLSAPQKTLSKFIHQPVVRNVSEVTGKTISRPSGLLGGGLLAFIGSSAYLYLAKHQGFDYNYIVWFMLFAGGFLVGLVLELIVWSATSSRRQASD